MNLAADLQAQYAYNQPGQGIIGSGGLQVGFNTDIVVTLHGLKIVIGRLVISRVNCIAISDRTGTCLY